MEYQRKVTECWFALFTLVIPAVLHVGSLYGATPPDDVLTAAYKGELMAVKAWVTEHPKDINAYGWGTRTLLHLAAAEGHLEIVDFLLQHQANPNQRGDCFHSSQSRQTPLHAAAWLGRTLVVERLLKAGASVNIREFGDQIPLHFAILSGKEEVARLLVAAGSNIHAPDRNGISPYDQALRERKPELARLLLLNASVSQTNASGDTALHIAAVRGAADEVEQLLSRKADLNAVNTVGLTALHVALEHGHSMIARALAKSGTRLDIFAAAGLGRLDEVVATLNQRPDWLAATNRQGRTVLHWAAMSGHEILVKRLLESGTPPDKEDAQGATALDLAAGFGHSKVVDQLLAAGAKSSIRRAVLSGDRHLVSRLLASGAPVDARNQKGRSPLHLAVEQSDPAMAELLIGKGADVNATDTGGETPLTLAIRAHEQKMVSLLLAATNAPPTAMQTQSPLHAAINSHNLKILPELAQGGAALEARDDRGRTPLWLALENNNIEAMHVLLKLGANVQARDADGNTALHHAVRYCYDWSDADDLSEHQPLWARWGNRTGLFLLAHKANIYATNYQGHAPIHVVGLRGERGNEPSPHVDELVTALIRAKADVNARDTNGMSALHLAVRTGGFPLVHALLAHGADVNLKDRLGRTPLHYALRGALDDPVFARAARPLPPSIRKHSLQPNIITLLVQHKADVNAADDEGNTPVQLAKEVQDPSVVDLLKVGSGN
jgi:ankyrin repeat protein